MDNILKWIFFLNTICFYSAIVIIDKITLRNPVVVSVSDFVRVGKDPGIFFEMIIMTGNFIQAIFSLYLFINQGFPAVVLLGVGGGVVGVLVSITRIDKHLLAHTILTIISLTFYSSAILFLALTYGNVYITILSILQLVGLVVAFLLRVRTKHIEVFYFTIFCIWNLWVILTLLK